ncbi:MAG: RIP metalloprotease [Eubacteriales bacterium]
MIRINTFVTILIAILVFGIMIFIHELGHFLSARASGVTVKEFAIGMGPKILWHRSKKTRTIYALRLFPIGGFCNMVGEDEEVDDAGSFSTKPIWKRLIIILAGAIMNLLLGFVLMSILVTSANGYYSPKVLRFASEGSMSDQTGLYVGDEIVKVNSKRINIYNDLVYALIRDGAQPVTLEVIRNGEKVVLKDVKFPSAKEGSITYGSVDFYPVVEEKTLGVVIKQTFFQSLSTVDMVWTSLLDLVAGKYGMEAVSGPVGVTKEIGNAVKSGPTNFLYLFAVITINLGVVNLLPLPALDGGRVVFLLIELVRGKPVKPEYEGYVHLVGIVLLLMLMVVVTYNDIVKIFAG